LSVRDGNLDHDNLYLTSDIALAAYLLMRGFELLGAIDNGSPRKEFGLTHADPEILANLDQTVRRYADEYDNLYLPIPHDPVIRVNFRVYTQKTRELHRALDEPIRKDG
jgi:hypothetical protein